MQVKQVQRLLLCKMENTGFTRMNKWRFLIIGLKNQYDRFQLIEPFERGEIFSQRAFLIFTDIRKLQEKAETSYTLTTEEVEVLI